jgi:hypothetical protein
MAPELRIRNHCGSETVAVWSTAELAWVNQASWRHCHFGLKSAPHHRDFRPGKEGVL